MSELLFEANKKGGLPKEVALAMPRLSGYYVVGATITESCFCSGQRLAGDRSVSRAIAPVEEVPICTPSCLKVQKASSTLISMRQICGLVSTARVAVVVAAPERKMKFVPSEVIMAKWSAAVWIAPPASTKPIPPVVSALEAVVQTAKNSAISFLGDQPRV
jgi:hypothetical protein